MKKILTIIVAICLIASVICITAFAADAPAAGVVLRVSALKKDGTTTVVIEDYKSFEDGWNAAMELADNRSEMKKNSYDRIVVDLYADWKAVDGQFTEDFWNGPGFDWDAIYIPEGVRVTLNLNGHTINRGLTTDEKNGEVMYIDEEADVIINNGTITGGNSNNSAGGIHINDGAMVTLNNVHVDGNRVEDDDGAAIAVYDGAVLIMNGGSLSNNVIYSSEFFFGDPYGALYLNDASAYLKDVEIANNISTGFDGAYGVAAYVRNGNLTMEKCTIKQNGYKDKSKGALTPQSIVAIDEGTMTFNECVFEDNGTPGNTSGPDVIELWGGTVKVNNSIFRNNICSRVIWSYEGVLQASDSRFEGNTCSVFCGEVDEGSYFKNCTFSGNTTNKNYKTFEFDDDNKLNFENCDFGDSTFNDRSLATFDGKAGVGSIFGEGSLTMIVAILALVASVVSTSLTVVLFKKVSAPVAANNTDESEDEE